MADDVEPIINVRPMCNTHRVLLVRQLGIGPDGPWRAVEIMTMLALFQAMTADPKVWEEIGGDATRLPELGCMACRKPDAFGEIIKAGQGARPGAIKELGESWVRSAAH